MSPAPPRSFCRPHVPRFQALGSWADEMEDLPTAREFPPFRALYRAFDISPPLPPFQPLPGPTMTVEEATAVAMTSSLLAVSNIAHLTLSDLQIRVSFRSGPGWPYARGPSPPD